MFVSQFLLVTPFLSCQYNMILTQFEIEQYCLVGCINCCKNSTSKSDYSFSLRAKIYMYHLTVSVQTKRMNFTFVSKLFLTFWCF